MKESLQKTNEVSQAGSNTSLKKYKYNISIQNITVQMKKTDILEQYPHLKSEWLPLANQYQRNYFKHAYSNDQTESVNLKSVPMKEVDIYSSREGYSYPFCPRIYKYVIEQNYQEGNRLCFDIVVLSQRVGSRLCQNFLLNATNEQIKFVSSKVNEIVKGFEYLYRRYGAFEITQKMIGWTQLGIVKVWFNEEFFLNKKSDSNASQASMIKNLITILQQNTLIKNTSFKKCTTFQALLNSLLYPEEKKQSEIIQQVACKPFQNFSVTFSELQYLPSLDRKQIQRQQIKPFKTRRNITFSYSNKDINARSSKNVRNSNKKCSIMMSHEDQNSMLARLSNNYLERQVIDTSPPSSLKTIHAVEKRTSKNRTSPFVIENSEEKYSNQNAIQVDKCLDNYSKTTVSYRAGNLRCNLESITKYQNRIRPEPLHYSTSSNPISQFLNVSRASNKAYSSIGNNHNEEIMVKPTRESSDSNFSEFSAKDVRLRILQNFEGLPLKIEQKDEEFNMRQSQQIQRDLDALFHSDHEFDYNEIENELDCIL